MAEQAAPDRLRIDRWLVHARVVKTRALAAQRIARGGVRINGQPCARASREVGPGDEVVFSFKGHVRVMRVRAIGTRRGPPSEAAELYDDLTQGASGDA